MDFFALLGWLEQYSIIPMFLVFVLLVVGAYRPGRKRQMERNARIPLDDEG
jgi:cbb3-type cytochrome oxidase subunit 3